jgi:hemoglobin
MRETIYHAAGGAETFHRLCNDFYRRVFADPLLTPLFHNPDEDHAGRLALWLIETFGGPEQYTQVRGGFDVMLASHQGLQISLRQRDRWVEHMLAACEAVALPPEVLEPISEYIHNGAFWAHIDSHRSG